MFSLIQFILRDLLRQRTLIGLFALFALSTLSVIALGQGFEKTLASLLTLVQLGVPLVALLYTVTYYHSTLDFVEYLAAQPISRTQLIMAFFISLASGIALAVFLGFGIPLLITHPTAQSVSLIGMAIGLAVTFTAVGLYVAARSVDRLRAVAQALGIWFLLSVALDGLLVLLLFNLTDYNLDLLGLSINFISPIDYVRNFTLMKLDAAAIMGYSGAVFVDFFTSPGLRTLSVFLFVPWILVPLTLAVRKFKNSDL